ncbi:MAG: hypothetical protein ACYC0X_33120 [Pirellulaceae bacterium]
MTVCVLLLCGNAANADTFDFTFENDAGAIGQYGTLEVMQGTAANGYGTLTFTIDVDNTHFLLGPAPDAYMFGFMLSFSGARLDPAWELLSFDNPPGTLNEIALYETGVTLKKNGQLAGGKVRGRNSVYTYIVDFGSGGTLPDPVSFRMVGWGLGLDDLYSAGVSSQVNHEDAQFMLHVQNTPGTAGLAAIGGLYEVPTPSSLVGLIGLGLMGMVSRIRRRRVS